MDDKLSLPGAELAELATAAAEISKQTKSNATKKAYRSDVRLFVEWCEKMELKSLPATPRAVGLYVTYLDRIGRRPATIRRKLTSINQAHVLAGHDSPINAQVLELKKGINRIRGLAQTQKTALTLDQLERCLICTPSDFIDVRDKAVLLVGWTGALRRSEICAIDVEDISETGEGLIITIGRSKTDQEGEGRQIGLPFVDQREDLCAVRHLRHWLAMAQIKSGPVFRGISRGAFTMFGDKKEGRIGVKTISAIVKRAVKRCGYDEKNYSGHSLRSGLATTLAREGIDEREIMGITGHRSLKSLRGYIQKGAMFRDHPILRLFAVPE